MTTATPQAPAIVRAASLPDSIKVEPLTCAIGAELLRRQPRRRRRATPACSPRSAPLLLKHKVLFLRDQDITRAEHVAFARHFGELEDHPVAGSDPENPGLVRIYKNPDSPNDRYENAWHTDATWREKPPLRLRAALRRVPAGRRRHDVGQHGAGLREAARARQDRRSPACAPATASRPASAPRCRRRSAWR